MKDYRQFSKLEERFRREISSFGTNSTTAFTVLISLIVSTIYTIVRYSSEILHGGDIYLTGDWLINYQGGYAQRGLNGQLLLFTSDHLGIDLLWVTYIEQCSLFFVFSYSVISIFRLVRGKFLWLMALNPAFMMFYFLDTGGAFRKELIGFACVSLLFFCRARAKVSKFVILVAPMLYFLMSFSWDLGTLFLPIIMYSYYRMREEKLISQNTFFLSVLAYLVTSASSVVGVLYFITHRSPATSSGICRSLVERGLSDQICLGTIQAISNVGLDFFSTAGSLMLNGDYPWYFPVLIIALVPIYWSGWIRNNVGLTILIFLSVLPLWIIEIDYGRNVHILVTFLTLSWAIDMNSIDTQKRRPTKQNSIIRYDLFFLLFSVLYTVSWRVPHAGGLPHAFFLGVIGRVLSWL